MIGIEQVNRCRQILEFDGVTNFETRMAAEIQLYWCMYEHCTVAHVDLEKVQSALDAWKQTWNLVSRSRNEMSQPAC
jgi:hypothetical protein